MDHLQQLTRRYPALRPCAPSIKKAFEVISASFSRGGKLLIAGNGGSAADAQHIVGELAKSFVKKRPLPQGFVESLEKADEGAARYLETRLQNGLAAMALTCHDALTTAVINDIDGSAVFAQQALVYGREGDVFMGISTSGDAKNVLYAAAVSKAKNLHVVALTGGSGGALAKMADAAIVAPETETYKIQELHMPVYHCLCLMLEDYFF